MNKAKYQYKQKGKQKNELVELSWARGKVVDDEQLGMKNHYLKNPANVFDIVDVLVDIQITPPGLRNERIIREKNNTKRKTIMCNQISAS